MFCGETIVPEGLTGLQLSFNFTVRVKLKGGICMTEKQTRNELFYQLSKELLDQMLQRNFITYEQYKKIDALNIEKYQPFFSKVS